MPRLTENQRLRAIGMLQAGRQQNEVAQQFGVHRNTISSLYRCYQHTGSTRDYPRPGALRVTSRLQDNHIRLTHLRNRFQSASLTARTIPGHQIINPRTVRNRLRAVNIRPRRPAIRSVLTRRHRVARLGWCRIRLRFTRRLWGEILFTDESQPIFATLVGSMRRRLRAVINSLGGHTRY